MACRYGHVEILFEILYIDKIMGSSSSKENEIRNLTREYVNNKGRDSVEQLRTLLVTNPTKNVLIAGQTVFDLKGISLKYKSLDESAKKRMLNLLCGDTVEPANGHSPSFDTCFNEFLQNVGLAGVENVKVLWKDHEQCKILRVQRSGLCFMLGPTVLQYYKVLMRNDKETTKHEIIDLSHYILHSMENDPFLKFIRSDTGGHSVRFLKGITALPDDDIESLIFSSVVTPQTVAEYFDKHGPGLVSGFSVHQDFYDKGVTFEGIPQGEDRGGHCMVLVGYVKDNKGLFKFILQNWWRDRHFILMSQDYFKACSPTISFVMTDLVYIPKDLPTISASYLETSLDQADAMPEGPYVLPPYPNEVF